MFRLNTERKPVLRRFRCWTITLSTSLQKRDIDARRRLSVDDSISRTRPCD
nr:MAG TPA: hypothetical protein [Caudoviricetes sp.]DAT43846.1 MAG TPA: hypothetical protein [Caudoviricetes sp.]